MFINERTKLKQSNKKDFMELKQEDQKLIKVIMARLSMSKVNSHQAQVIKRDLMGLAQDSRLRGSSLNADIDNLEEFADDLFVSASSSNTIELVLGFAIRLTGYFFVWFLLGSFILYSGFNWQINSLLLPMYIMIVLISYLLELFIAPRFALKSGLMAVVPNMSIIVCIMTLISIGTHYTKGMATYDFNVFPTMIICGLLFVIFRSVDNRLINPM